MESPLLSDASRDVGRNERQNLIPRTSESPSCSTPREQQEIHQKVLKKNARPVLLFLLALLLSAIYCEIPSNLPSTESPGSSGKKKLSGWEIAPCDGYPCFEAAEIHVPTTSSGFPSFLNYANRGPISIGYDNRSLKINGDRVFFLGGSMHPARATLKTWKLALDEAVEIGLNLITIYVMWSDHQPIKNREIDWTFPDWSSPENGACRDFVADGSCSDWNLAEAIRMAGNHGLFVHLRIGPYDCAEYSYGGFPEWLLLEKPHMQLRRPNREWLKSKLLLKLSTTKLEKG